MKKIFLVEIVSYEGEQSGITLYTPKGTAHMYSIGVVRSDGVIELIDNGYSSALEAREVWPGLALPDRGEV